MNEPKSIYCPGCANPVSFEKNFCPKCGMNISMHKQKMLEKFSAEQARAAGHGEVFQSARELNAEAGGAAAEPRNTPGVASDPARKSSVFEAFVYPLKGNGPFALIAFFILILVNIVIQRTAFTIAAAALTVGIAYLFIKAAVFGYITLFFFSIVENSSSGKSELPDWPDISGVWDLFSAAIMQAILFILTILPVILYLILSAVYKAEPSKQMIAATAIWAALYYPMALMVLAETRNLAAIMPWTILMFIIRASWKYFVICFLIFLSYIPFALIFAARASAEKSLFYKFTPADIAAPFFYFYGNIVMCRLLGVFCAELCRT